MRVAVEEVKTGWGFLLNFISRQKTEWIFKFRFYLWEGVIILLQTLRPRRGLGFFG